MDAGNKDVFYSYGYYYDTKKRYKLKVKPCFGFVNATGLDQSVMILGRPRRKNTSIRDKIKIRLLSRKNRPQLITIYVHKY